MRIESKKTTLILVPWRLCGETNNIKVAFLIRLDARSHGGAFIETSYPAVNPLNLDSPLYIKTLHDLCHKVGLRSYMIFQIVKGIKVVSGEKKGNKSAYHYYNRQNIAV